MSDTPTTDALGRPVVADSIRAQIDTAFKAVPPDKRGAVLILADDTGTRAHFAARIDDHWRVAAGAGWQWSEKRPSGYVGVECVW